MEPKSGKGAFDTIRKIAEEAGNPFPKEAEEIIERVAGNGGTPLVVCINRKVVGVIELQDIIKPGIEERFERLRKMGVKTVMVTGIIRVRPGISLKKQALMISSRKPSPKIS